MIRSIFTEPPGIVVLVFLVLLLLASVVITICCKKTRNGFKRNEVVNKYMILKNEDMSVDLKHNNIQPPSESRISVRLVSSIPPNRNKKKSVIYADDCDGGISVKENSNTERTMQDYKQKFFGLLNKSVKSNTRKQKYGSKPDLIETTDRKSIEQPRLRRADSIYDYSGLGRVTFSLRYSSNDEFLTVHLIAGRQIYSHDSLYEVRLPAISIQIEGLPETEVTSNPDEAPNPEYDQEFTFLMREHELRDTILKFTVWDIVSNNESRVLGFFRVNLTHFQKTIVENGDSGPLCRDIQASLTDRDEDLGDVLLSLFYDCVTDKIRVKLRKLQNLAIHMDDTDVYVKVSFLLDNDVIQSKRTAMYPSSQHLILNQTFEFSALSDDLHKLSTSSPHLRVTDELMSHTSKSTLYSTQSPSTSSSSSRYRSSSLASETLRNNMGILISVRAATANKNKRVVGRLYVGRTNVPTNEEDFHWLEMVKNFDNTITQWHQLRLAKF